jgi:putative flippase GtrA
MLKFLARVHRSPSHKSTFIRFACVGTAISVVDTGILYLGLVLGMHAYPARMISLPCSMLVGYFLNRYFTFHHFETGRALWHSLLRHFAVHSVGGVINIGVYAIVLEIGQAMGGQVVASATLPITGVWIGGVVGLCFNYFFSQKLVFDR